MASHKSSIIAKKFIVKKSNFIKFQSDCGDRLLLKTNKISNTIDLRRNNLFRVCSVNTSLVQAFNIPFILTTEQAKHLPGNNRDQWLHCYIAHKIDRYSYATSTIRHFSGMFLIVLGTNVERPILIATHYLCQQKLVLNFSETFIKYLSIPLIRESNFTSPAWRTIVQFKFIKKCFVSAWWITLVAFSDALFIIRR